jgi:hypothetical protein
MCDNLSKKAALYLSLQVVEIMKLKFFVLFVLSVFLSNKVKQLFFFIFFNFLETIKLEILSKFLRDEWIIKEEK